MITWSHFQIDPKSYKDKYGFIYQISYTDGTSYIGKKNLWTETALPLLKNGTYRSDTPKFITRREKMTEEDLVNRTPLQIKANVKSKIVHYEIIKKESNWKKYTGSSKLSEGKEILSKMILEYAPSKRYLTYLEVKHMFMLGVLESDTYLNENISGKWYKGNLL